MVFLQSRCLLLTLFRFAKRCATPRIGATGLHIMRHATGRQIRVWRFWIIGERRARQTGSKASTRRELVKLVYDAIVAEILDGRLLAGARLIRDQLVHACGASPHPIGARSGRSPTPLASPGKGRSPPTRDLHRPATSIAPMPNRCSTSVRDVQSLATNGRVGSSSRYCASHMLEFDHQTPRQRGIFVKKPASSFFSSALEHPSFRRKGSRRRAEQFFAENHKSWYCAPSSLKTLSSAAAGARRACIYSSYNTLLRVASDGIFCFGIAVTH